MKKIAEGIVEFYLALGDFSFIISIKFGILGIFVLAYNFNQYLSGESPSISLPVAFVVAAYTFITTLPWLSGIYLKVNDNSERKRKHKNPQFISIIQQKIKLDKPLDAHEEEFITKSITERLQTGAEVSVEEEAYFLLNDLEQFEYFLFRYPDDRFARMFDYFASTLNDDGIKLIFSKIPTRMTKYIKSGKMSDEALLRVQRLFINH